jgi:hypothetical protein
VLVVQGQFYWAFGHFRTLVGGRAEAGRVTLTHQVFAAYRRLDPAQLHTLIARAQPYTRDIDQAAAAFGLDPDLLHGVAATESSFLPRPSSDGGPGPLSDHPRARRGDRAGRSSSRHRAPGR